MLEECDPRSVYCEFFVCCAVQRAADRLFATCARGVCSSCSTRMCLMRRRRQHFAVPCRSEKPRSDGFVSYAGNVLDDFAPLAEGR